MLKRVLVPIDFSEESLAAMRTALELAGSTHAEVVLIHAYELPPLALAEPVYFPSSLIEESQRALEAKLDELLKQEARPGLQLRGSVVVGSAALVIVEAATQEKADLIVMGTHGRRGLRRWAVGSVTERVVRTSTIPVLAVRGMPPLHSDTLEPSG